MGFKMPEVDNCCCCISLRTGTITYMVLSCIGSFIALILSGIAVGGANHYDFPDLTPEEVSALKTVAIILVVISLLGVLFSIFMTWGAVHRKTGILKVSIVLLCIGVVVDCIFIIVVPFQSITKGQKIMRIVLYILQGVFAAYQLLVVHSYRQQILRETNSGTTH